jgi:hypothetical protein
MDPLDVEDVLIFFQRHVGINLFEFRCLLIFGELCLPGLLHDGGTDPLTGFHSVIERPERVRRTNPPKTMRNATMHGKRQPVRHEHSDYSHHGAITRGAGALPASLRHGECFSEF